MHRHTPRPAPATHRAPTHPLTQAGRRAVADGGRRRTERPTRGQLSPHHSRLSPVPGAPAPLPLVQVSVYPVSARWSSRIRPELLGGARARTLPAALKESFAKVPPHPTTDTRAQGPPGLQRTRDTPQNETDIVILPFFFGLSDTVYIIAVEYTTLGRVACGRSWAGHAVHTDDVPRCPEESRLPDQAARRARPPGPHHTARSLPPHTPHSPRPHCLPQRPPDRGHPAAPARVVGRTGRGHPVRAGTGRDRGPRVGPTRRARRRPRLTHTRGHRTPSPPDHHHHARHRRPHLRVPPLSHAMPMQCPGEPHAAGRRGAGAGKARRRRSLR